MVYYHTDALGSPVAVTAANRTVLERSEYEPYGKLLNRPLTDGPGYTGHVSDAATGLSYMQQRYYDPTIGRFLSVDPVTANGNTGANFNRYWYANNNPYRFNDPDGRYSCDKSTCRFVRNALKDLNRSARYLAKHDPAKAAIVQAAITEIGTKGSPGPAYVSGNLDSEAIAATDQNGHTTIDLRKIKGAGKNEPAKALAHEATHDIDARTKKASDETSFRKTETNAYGATQAAALGLHEVITDDQIKGVIEQSVIFDLQQLEKNSDAAGQ